MAYKFNPFTGKLDYYESGGISDHALLTHLDYVSSLHTGFEPTVTKGNLTEATSSILTILGGTGAVIGAGTSIQVKQASGAQSGYLSSGDWTIFNNKLSSVTPHNLLSSIHGDTVAASPVLGDLLYGDATPNWTKLAGNVTTTKKFLTQTGLGAVSAIPAWDTIAIGDLPTITLVKGGTGLTTIADGSVLATNSADVLSPITWHAAGTKVLTNISGTISWETAAGGGQTLYDAIVATSGGDYTDIQSAITAGKLRIFVRAGTYTLGANIVIAADDTWIVGESWASIIACGTTYKISLNGKNRCHIENLKITGTQVYPNGLVDGVACSNSVIRGNFFDAVFAIHFGTSGSYNLIAENYITGATGTFGILVEYPVVYTTVINNIIYNFGTSTNTAVACIEVGGTADKIIGNLIKNAGNNTCQITDGIDIEGLGYSLVSNNTIDGLQSKTTSDGIINGIHAFSAGCIISDNNIQNLGSVDCYTIVGILAYQDYTTVKGNVIYSIGNTTDGVAITGIWVGNYCAISGNNINTLNAKASGGTVTGIDLSNGGTTGKVDNSITGNKIASPSAEVSYGIRINTANRDVITGNSIQNLQFTYPIDTQGTQNIIRHNFDVPIIYEQDGVKMRNTSGGALARGNIVVLKAVAGGNEITTTTTAGDNKVFGVLDAAVNDNAIGFVKTLGKTVYLTVDGTLDIAIGDFISCFTTAGIGKKAVAGETAIAIALEAYATNDSAGVIDALVITPRLI